VAPDETLENRFVKEAVFENYFESNLIWQPWQLIEKRRSVNFIRLTLYNIYE
jgi:hypothetical protein